MDQELADTATYVQGRHCMCTYHMAAILKVWCHTQKSNTVNRWCVFTSSKYASIDEQSC